MDDQQREATVDTIKTGEPQPGLYRYYVLFILTLTYVFSFMDRQIMAILIEDIRLEFNLNDAQAGSLMGFAFAVVYATLGVPVARLADRYSRRNIVAAALTFWSAATALCGAATGYWTLFLARIGVGVGEAGGAPPSQSMIGDYFKRSELSRAISIHSLGLTIGAFLGLALGGFVADAIGWRMTFVALGIPGVVLGLVLFFTVREPERGRFDPNYDPNKPSPKLRETIKSLWTNRPYMGTLIAANLKIFLSYIVTTWGAAILIRNFGLTKTEVGLYFGLAILIGGGAGTIAAGYLCDKLGKTNAQWMAWLPAIVTFLSIPVYFLAMLAPTAAVMLFAFVLSAFCSSMATAASFATIQASVRSDERALASSIQFFFGSLLGLGLGPVIAGWISEMLKPYYPDTSLNYAVLILTVFLVASGFTYLWTARQMKGKSLETLGPAAA